MPRLLKSTARAGGDSRPEPIRAGQPALRAGKLSRSQSVPLSSRVDGLCGAAAMRKIARDESASARQSMFGVPSDPDSLPKGAPPKIPVSCRPADRNLVGLAASVDEIPRHRPAAFSHPVDRQSQPEARPNGREGGAIDRQSIAVPRESP